MTNPIPNEVITTIAQELTNVYFGKINLEISIHDNHPKYRIIKEISIIPGKNTSGEQIKKNKEFKNEFN